ncbi:MAG TPA: SDR family NAD(P)-dependent oxidoreductase [Verrucomicrobiota bacterium]|nr:SDR family NAD(P)-dependent oxidoreductase [Verrucomicrobiota bacterium]
MSGRLTGKSVVIIGGTSGLGLAATRACVREGARVVVVGRDAAKAEQVAQTLGSDVRRLVADAGDSATASRAIELAMKEFGSFDALYHVAGGSGRRHGDGPLHEITDEGWRYTLDQNLTALFHSNRAAVQQFLKLRQGGSIVNCGSVLGFSPSPQFFSTHAYATAKAGIIGLTKSAAAYYAPHHIRLNVVAPGLVATPMSQRAQADEDILAFIRTKQPLGGGRIGKPEDLDAAVVWLLSDESNFVTGQVIAVDGGWSVTEGHLSRASAPVKQPKPEEPE